MLLSITNGLFITVAGLVIAIFAALGFIRTGSFSILMMGGGNLAFGLSAGIAGLVVGLDGPNANVTIYNCGAFTGALLHLIGAINLHVRRPGLFGQSFLIRKLLIGYLFVIFIVIAIATAALLKLTPIFFVQGQGPTLLQKFDTFLPNFRDFRPSLSMNSSTYIDF